jgi:hypothetical protein
VTVDDQATAAEERNLALCLAIHAATVPPPLAHGTCHQCFESCTGAFCEDNDCRDQYQRRMNMARINGR